MSLTFYIESNDETPCSETSLACLLETVAFAKPGFDKNDVSYAKLNFILEVVGEVSFDDFKFRPFEKMFRTRKNHQVLIIDTRRMNEGVEKGRFKVRGVWAEDKGKDHLEQVLVESTSHELRLIDHAHPITDDEVTMIVLEFDMPGGKKTDSFGFFLTIEDTKAEVGKKSKENCDPQVGNDPPMD